MDHFFSSVIIACTFLWIGFVCAISFMEAWLKFRAPGISVPLGLGIGRLVFNALNKVEWVLAVAIVCSLLFGNIPLLHWHNLFLVIPVIALIVQTFYALPKLDARAELHIKGLPVERSRLHFHYVIMELKKVIGLIVFGIIHLSGN
jgi:hypothetical protein